MGVVRDVTIEQLTQAVGGIDTSGLAKDTTLQATNTALGNINTTLGGITTNDPPTDTTQQSIATALQIIGQNVKPNASDIPYDSNLSVKGKIDEVADILGNKLNVAVMTSGSMNNVKSSGLYYLGNAVTDKPINIGGMFLAMFGNPNVAVGLYVGYASSGTAVYRSIYSNGVWTHYAV